MSARPDQKWGVIYNGDALTLDDILHFAGLADQAGADSLWTAEGWRDAFVPLTAIAGVAKRARVGTGIVQMARPPVLTTLSALSMAEYTRGRFILGVALDRGSGTTTGTDLTCHIRSRRSANTLNVFVLC